jgi:hypothetical protein
MCRGLLGLDHLVLRRSTCMLNKAEAVGGYGDLKMASYLALTKTAHRRLFEERTTSKAHKHQCCPDAVNGTVEAENASVVKGTRKYGKAKGPRNM